VIVAIFLVLSFFSMGPMITN